MILTIPTSTWSLIIYPRHIWSISCLSAMITPPSYHITSSPDSSIRSSLTTSFLVTPPSVQEEEGFDPAPSDPTLWASMEGFEPVLVPGSWCILLGGRLVTKEDCLPVSGLRISFTGSPFFASGPGKFCGCPLPCFSRPELECRSCIAHYDITSLYALP